MLDQCGHDNGDELGPRYCHLDHSQYYSPADLKTTLDVKETIGNCCRDFGEVVDRALGNPSGNITTPLKSKGKRLAKMEENVDRSLWVGRGVAGRVD